jgi:hypothetical protein
VIDGDTVAIARERIRVLGIDAPETREARCERERVAGYRAKARVVDLLRFGRSIDIHRQGHDQYGRTLARIIVVAEIWASSSCARSWRCPIDQAQRPEPNAWHAGAPPAREARD